MVRKDLYSQLPSALDLIPQQRDHRIVCALVQLAASYACCLRPDRFGVINSWRKVAQDGCGIRRAGHGPLDGCLCDACVPHRLQYQPRPQPHSSGGASEPVRADEPAQRHCAAAPER